MNLKKLFNHSLMIILFASLMITLSGCKNNGEADDTVNIKVNQMECFSGKTKQEIYDIRKKYVAKSIFKSKDYEPSEEVFGQIEDGLPWRSVFTELCHNEDNKEFETRGPSEESRFINNPIMLVGLLHWGHTPTYYRRCDGTIGWAVPYRITYSENDKLITAYYKNMHALNKDLYFVKNFYNNFSLKKIDNGTELVTADNISLYETKLAVGWGKTQQFIMV